LPEITFYAINCASANKTFCFHTQQREEQEMKSSFRLFFQAVGAAILYFTGPDFRGVCRENQAGVGKHGMDYKKLFFSGHIFD